MPEACADHGPPLSAIALDLDGTMVDSLPDLCTAVNHTLGALSLPALSEPVLRALVGDGLGAVRSHPEAPPWRLVSRLDQLALNMRAPQAVPETTSATTSATTAEPGTYA